MNVQIWLKAATINETIVLLHEIARFVGDGSEVELGMGYLNIKPDLAAYTDDESEQTSILAELVEAILSRPSVEKVERA